MCTCEHSYAIGYNVEGAEATPTSAERASVRAGSVYKYFYNIFNEKEFRL